MHEFEPETESISAQLFFDANDIGEGKKVPVLLSLIGRNTYALFRNLVAPASPKDKSFKELTEQLTSHFEPKPLVIAERFNFYRRSQQSGETIARLHRPSPPRPLRVRTKEREHAESSTHRRPQETYLEQSDSGTLQLLSQKSTVGRNDRRVCGRTMTSSATLRIRRLLRPSPPRPLRVRTKEQEHAESSTHQRPQETYLEQSDRESSEHGGSRHQDEGIQPQS